MSTSPQAQLLLFPFPACSGPLPPPILQVTQPYHPGNTHRADLSFAVYGFAQRQDPPILCTQVKALPDKFCARVP